MRYILITGNPVNGFKFCGPYDTHHDAVVDGEHVHNGDWWVAELYSFPYEINHAVHKDHG